MRELLLCPPDYYGIEYEINPWMSRARGAEAPVAQRESIEPLLSAARRTIPTKSSGDPHDIKFPVAIFEDLHLISPNWRPHVTAAAAQLSDCDYVVTRDAKGFRGSPVRPLAPEAALPLLGMD